MWVDGESDHMYVTHYNGQTDTLMVFEHHKSPVALAAFEVSPSPTPMDFHRLSPQCFCSCHDNDDDNNIIYNNTNARLIEMFDCATHLFIVK